MIKNQKELKREIFRKKSTLTDEEIFLSQSYEEFLKQMQMGILQIDGVKCDVSMYAVADGSVATTSKDSTKINYMTEFAEGLSRNEKHMVYTGLNLHELGHKVFSDFSLMDSVLQNIINGIIYPMPTTNTPYLDELEAYIAKGATERGIVHQMFMRINNCIEDGFVDRAIKTFVPGYAPYLDFVLSVDKSMPQTLYKERINKKEAEEYIFADLLLFYARHGIRLYEANDSGEVIDAMKEAEKIIMEAVSQAIPMLRMKKVWEVFCYFFHFVRQKQNSGQSGQQSSSAQNNTNSQENQKSNSQSGQNNTSENQSNAELSKMAQNLPNTEKSTHAKTSANEQAVKALKEEMNEKKENVSAHSSAKSSASNKELDQILSNVASSSVAKEQEKEIQNSMQREVSTVSNGVHRNINGVVDRISVSNEGATEYLSKHAQLDAIEKRLCREFKKEITERQTGDTLTGLYMGKRITTRELHRHDKKIFSSKKLPEDIPDMAIGILIDLSGSMRDKRISKAKECAYITYKFCKDMGIPVFVIGHNDRIDIHLYSAVDEYSLDHNDEKRIFSLKTAGSNRDGYALRYCLNKLRKMPAEQKLMMVISDGRPASDGYGLIEGREDCQSAVIDAIKDGIKTIAAGIGEDAASVKSVYKEGKSEKNSATFLDMSDLEKLPKSFVKIIKSYLE